jgi:hypothetical protein
MLAANPLNNEDIKMHKHKLYILYPNKYTPVKMFQLKFVFVYDFRFTWQVIKLSPSGL